MDPLSTLAVALGAPWASGINLYATVLMLGGLGLSGVVDLPANLEPLASVPVLIVAAVLYGLEFFADKIPGVDMVNDFLHTFIRVPAGALMAAGAVGHLDVEWATAIALVGGGAMALSSHAAKAGSRAVINTSPEPFSNIVISFTEDVMVVAALSLALFKPVVFFVLFGLMLLAMIWLLPKIWRGIRGFFGRYRASAQAAPWRPDTWAPETGPPRGVAAAGPTPDPDPEPGADPLPLPPSDDGEGPPSPQRP